MSRIGSYQPVIFARVAICRPIFWRATSRRGFAVKLYYHVIQLIQSVADGEAQFPIDRATALLPLSRPARSLMRAEASKRHRRRGNSHVAGPPSHRFVRDRAPEQIDET